MSKLKYYKNGQWNEVGGNIAGDTLPIGAIVPYGSETAPTNWLVCDGSAVSRTTYAELFNAIGTSFGAGDGSTTFNLPNLKGRVAVGQDTSDTDFDTMGEKGGSKYLQEHYHEYKYGQTAGGDGSGLAFSSTIGTQPNKAAITNVKGVTTGNAGNLQPYQVVCYIIKAKQSAGVVANVSKTYSTSETDAYSCDYVNELETYSTTEKRIGTWIDGKPIYRKVVVTDPITADMGTSFSFTIATGIETLTNASAFTQTTGHARYLPILAQQVQLENDWDLDRSSHTLYLYLKRPDTTSYQNGVVHCIIEYTKTTN